MYHQGYLERAQLIDCFQAWLAQDDLSMDAEDLVDCLHHEQTEAYKQRYYELVDDALELLRAWYPVDSIMALHEELYELEEIMVIAPLLYNHNDKHEDEQIDLTFFHGYMQAVVLTSEPLSANEWIPNIFAGEMPSFDSIEEANAQLAVLMQCYNRLNQLRLEQMLHCPFRLEDRHREWWLGGIRQWCRGFVMGMNLRLSYWEAADTEPGAEDINAALIIVMAIADDAVVHDLHGTQNNGDINQQGSEFLAQAILTLPDAIRVLTEHTQTQDGVRVTNLPIRSNKVGRNAPCPCDSGKKFKKCCGAPGRAVH